MDLHLSFTSSVEDEGQAHEPGKRGTIGIIVAENAAMCALPCLAVVSL